MTWRVWLPLVKWSLLLQYNMYTWQYTCIRGDWLAYSRVVYWLVAQYFYTIDARGACREPWLQAYQTQALRVNSSHMKHSIIYFSQIVHLQPAAALSLLVSQVSSPGPTWSGSQPIWSAYNCFSSSRKSLESARCIEINNMLASNRYHR